MDEWTQELRAAVGAHARSLRKQAGLTQVQAAKSSGIPQPSLSSLERGQEMFGVARLALLARAYGVELPDMLPAFDLDTIDTP